MPTPLLAVAGDQGSAVAHVGIAFPLLLTSKRITVSGVEWREARWETPGRQGVAWVTGDALTTTQPEGVAQASFDALDEELAAYLIGLGDHVGIKVFDVTRGTSYTYNSDRTYIAASSIKMPIMLAFLSQVEAENREPTAQEMSELALMIGWSDNDAASALYAKIGAAQGMAKYLDQIGVKGLRPEGFVVGWGWSDITPSAMVQLFGLLNSGEILTPEHRALALDLMENEQPHLRYGVGDTAPAGATVAMKTGHVIGPDGRMAVNSSGIVTVGSETYILAAYTEHNISFEAGQEILRRVSAAVAAALI